VKSSEDIVDEDVTAYPLQLLDSVVTGEWVVAVGLVAPDSFWAPKTAEAVKPAAVTTTASAPIRTLK
jgi:hypothetical protein